MSIYNIPTKPNTDEHFETLLQNSNITIERIVSYGIASPEHYWYDQKQSEWVTVLEGCAELEYSDGTKISLEKGSCVLIPTQVKHRVSKVSDPCIWLAIKF